MDATDGCAQPVRDAGDGRDLQVLARTTRLLAMFTSDRRRIDLASAAQELDANRSTTYRYLASMEKHGLLARRGGRGYVLGPALTRVGVLALTDAGLLDEASAALPELSESVGETVVLSLWGGRGPLVTKVHAEHSRFIRLSVPVGTTLPITTAQGLVFLAFLDDVRAIDRCLQELDLPQRRALLARAAVVRGCGLAFSDASRDGLRGIAAPVFAADGSLLASLALLGTAARLPTSVDDPRVNALREVAARLSRGDDVRPLPAGRDD